MMTRAMCVGIVAAAVVGAGAFAQPVRSNVAQANEVISRLGLDLVTVGHVGNRAVIASELDQQIFHPQRLPDNFGQVNHEYRIGRSEIGSGLWVDFLNAYSPFHEAAGGQRATQEFGIGFTYNPNLSQPANYAAFPGDENRPSTFSWYMAARFCNWLHNGAKTGEQLTAMDFERGAYDASTFQTAATLPDGTLVSTEQVRRSEGARFWIPSTSEWVKAAHYDPDRYGEGEEGYWKRMGLQDEPLTPGPPELGGETNAGGGSHWPSGYDPEDYSDSGSYPDVQSFFGLLDTSGGAIEWTEDKRNDSRLLTGEYTNALRIRVGSSIGSSAYASLDVMDDLLISSPTLGTLIGLRVAAIVPAPNAALVLAISACALPRRRR